MNVKTIQPKTKEQSRYYVTVTMMDGMPHVYNVADHAISDFGFLYLYEESDKDKHPLAMINLGMAGTIDFSDNKPEIVMIENLEDMLEDLEQDVAKIEEKLDERH